MSLKQCRRWQRTDENATRLLHGVPCQQNDGRPYSGHQVGLGIQLLVAESAERPVSCVPHKPLPTWRTRMAVGYHDHSLGREHFYQSAAAAAGNYKFFN